MGFMNFLKKKDSSELSFKEAELPVPPDAQKNFEETVPEPTGSNAPESFTEVNHEEFMPPTSNVSTDDKPEHTIPEGEPEHKIPEGEPEHTIPLDEPVTPALTLPDLPALPQKALDDSTGVIATPEEVSTEPVEAPVVPEPPTEPTVDSEAPTALEAEPTVEPETPPEEEPIAPEPATNNAAEPPLDAEPELPDPYPEDTEATYLPEEQDEGSEAEHYVEAHEFYEALLNIKAMKKNLREQDADMRAWEELDETLEKKTTGILKNIDDIQENLIKIDTVLFEG